MIENQEDLKSGVALSDGPVRNPDIVSIEKEREKRWYTLQLLSHTLSRKNLLALTGLFFVFLSGDPPVWEPATAPSGRSSAVAI